MTLIKANKHVAVPNRKLQCSWPQEAQKACACNATMCNCHAPLNFITLSGVSHDNTLEDVILYGTLLCSGLAQPQACSFRSSMGLQAMADGPDMCCRCLPEIIHLSFKALQGAIAAIQLPVNSCERCLRMASGMLSFSMSPPLGIELATQRSTFLLRQLHCLSSEPQLPRSCAWSCLVCPSIS